MNFSQNLGKLMKNNKITPKSMSNYRLAQLVGVSQTTVKSWLDGITTPDLKKLAEISELFEVSTDYLLGKTENPTITNDSGASDLQDPMALEFANKFKLLTDEQQEMIIAQMKVLIKHQKSKE